eukprot:TRINITY_DN40599_c0_g1_i1.p1 TRINITY_DN40599_c0_g1~~TRINITY_DN40599_c0_g1_i1.p1  ORF type:complete len:190 (-),score=16.71 TRINITY_DN40599_c0_g1_i1:88-657(-)
MSGSEHAAAADEVASATAGECLPSIAVTLLTGDSVTVDGLRHGSCVGDLARALHALHACPPGYAYSLQRGGTQLEESAPLGLEALDDLSAVLLETTVQYAGGYSGGTSWIDGDARVTITGDSFQWTSFSCMARDDAGGTVNKQGTVRREGDKIILQGVHDSDWTVTAEGLVGSLANIDGPHPVTLRPVK